MHVCCWGQVRMNQHIFYIFTSYGLVKTNGISRKLIIKTMVFDCFVDVLLLIVFPLFNYFGLFSFSCLFYMDITLNNISWCYPSFSIIGNYLKMNFNFLLNQFSASFFPELKYWIPHWTAVARAICPLQHVESVLKRRAAACKSAEVLNLNSHFSSAVMIL